jgi:hypothetical protein
MGCIFKVAGAQSKRHVNIGTNQQRNKIEKFSGLGVLDIFLDLGNTCSFLVTARVEQVQRDYQPTDH